MVMLDLVDETFVVADPARVSELVHDPGAWARWWPDLSLDVFEDRGWAGLRWHVTGALVGSAELWLEAWGDGVLIHYYLRAVPTRRGSATVVVGAGDPVLTGRARRLMVREGRRRSLRARWVGNDIKDLLEANRPAGRARG